MEREKQDGAEQEVESWYSCNRSLSQSLGESYGQHGPSVLSQTEAREPELCTTTDQSSDVGFLGKGIYFGKAAFS